MFEKLKEIKKVYFLYAIIGIVFLGVFIYMIILNQSSKNTEPTNPVLSGVASETVPKKSIKNIEQANKTKKKYKYANMKINGNLSFVNSTKKMDNFQKILKKYGGTTKKSIEFNYLLSINTENIVLTYDKKGEKPDFTILSGSKNYVNSGNKIVFPLSKNLVLLFHNYVRINNVKFWSGDVLNIKDINLLPQFNKVDYSFSGNTLYSLNLKTDTDIARYLNIKSKLGTDGVFTFIGNKRTNSKIEDTKLIGYIKKDVADFRNDLGGKLYTGKVDGISSGAYVMYDFTDHLKTSYTGGNLIIKYKNLPKDLKFKLFFTEQDNFSNQKNNYLVDFQTIKNLEIAVSKNMYTEKNKLNNYHICLNQPLDEAKTKKSLYKVLGTGNISLIFSTSDKYRAEKNNQNNCLMFYYYLNPEKENKFEANIYSLYGGKQKAIINIGKYEISDNYKSQEIVGDDINILPRNGKWGDKIQLAVKNNKSVDVYTENCYIDPKHLLNKLKTAADNDDYYNNPDYRFILTCGKQSKQIVKLKDFAYWKSILSDIKLGKANIFKKSLGDGDDGKLFIRTNLGLLTKKDSKNLFVWVNNLDDGKPTQGVNFSLYSLKGKKLITKVYKNVNGYKKIPFITGADLTYVVVNKGTDTNFAFIGKNYNDIKIDNHWESVRGKSFISKYSLISNYYGVKTQGTKVYAYTDRVLYKPGDNVFVSGWIRDLEKLLAKQVITKGKVSIGLYHNGKKIGSVDNLHLDDFGGFKGKLSIPKTAELGNYYIQVDSTVGRSYTQYIQVQEYKKSSFNISYKVVNGKYLRVEPKYYFGKYLDKYDLSFNYSFKGNSNGIYNRDWCNNDQGYCDEPIYYNLKRDLDEDYSKDYNIQDYTGKYVDIPLSGSDNKLFGTLSYDMTVVDKASNEVVNKSFIKRKAPKYAIGFKGWDDDRVYDKDGNIKLDGKLLKHTEDGNYDQKIRLSKFENIKDAKVDIKIYHRDYKDNEEKGPDGDWYYTNGSNYKLIKSDTVNVKDGDFKYDFKAKDGGEYFIRAIYKGYEVQKVVGYYKDSYAWWGYDGDRKNNFVLDVSVNDKKYKPGDKLQVNINPYIKGAYAIITVEQGDKIKYTKTQVLDGKPIELTVQKDWFPNAYISVALIAGEKINNKISKHRKEPKFLIGYEEVKLNKSLYNLNFGVKILGKDGKEKKYFKLGEKVTLKITTVDNNGVFKDARLSVGIVDKALLDIYDKLRKPMEYFYNRYGDYILNDAIYKNLYDALKVFTANGEKGGGGGGDASSILNVRKKFYDLAFWRGAVYTKNGQLTLTTKVPDNLTTWVVDIIGITKDGKMGTFRKSFKVSKDVILQPNLPSFVTLGDKLEIPYKIVKNKDIKNLKVYAYATLGTKKYDLTQKGTTFLLDMNKFNYDDIYKNGKLTLFMDVKAGNTVYDAVQKDIIIRKSGFILSKFLFENTKNFEKTVELKPSSKYGTVSLYLSYLPIGAFEKAFKYLLHYPYGCTEQLMSGLYPTTVADVLAKHNLLSKDIINNGQINLNDGRRSEENKKYYDINKVVEDTLGKIYRNQKANGGMGYWPDESEQPDNYLSAYVYGAFRQIEKGGYKVDQDFMKKLKNYILNTKDKNVIMYYYLQEAFVDDKVDLKFVKENANSDIGKVLAYITLKLKDKNYKNDKLKEEVKNILAKSNLSEGAIRRNGVFFNQIILKSFYIRAIDDKLSDQYVIDLLESRNQGGVWAYSTQENVQALFALGNYMIRKQSDKKANYNVSIDGKVFSGDLQNNNKHIVYSFKDKKAINIKLNSSKKLLYDVRINYFPTNIKDIKSQSQNVSLFKLGAKLDNETTGGTIKDRIKKAKIGDTIDFVGGFDLKKDAKKLAISFYIPSNIQLINPTLKGKNNIIRFINTDKFNFTDKKDGSNRYYSCTPNHYEVRFDRLFLYYNNMKANHLCKVVFKGFKTHNGDVNMMNAKLFEMYDTNVWAQKVVR